MLEPEELRLAILSFLITCCLSQSNTATITGTVVDMHGAAITGAAVFAVHDATGIRMEVRTNPSGAYAIPGLPLGPYSLSVEKAGFRRYSQTGFILTTGQTLELNATLDLGAITETINVPSREALRGIRAHRMSARLSTPGASKIYPWAIAAP